MFHLCQGDDLFGEFSEEFGLDPMISLSLECFSGEFQEYTFRDRQLFHGKKVKK